MYFALAYGLLIIGSEFNMFDEFVDAWLDAVEHWLWIDAGEHDGCYKHAEQQAFAASDFGECLVGFAWLAVEDALISPQQI